MITKTILFASMMPITSACAGISGTDDFNDNSLHPANWSAIPSATSKIVETNQHLEFMTLGTPQNLDQSVLLWAKNNPTTASSWSITLDLKNSYVPKLDPFDGSDYLRGATIALAVSGGSGSASVGFNVEKLSGWGFEKAFSGISSQFSGEDESTDVDLTGESASVKISYDKDSGLLTTYYDANGPAFGYSWQELSSTGITAWKVPAGGALAVTISMGYTGSKAQAPAAGDLSADNFKAETTSNKPPSISGIASQEIPMNSSVGPLNFSVDDLDEPAGSLNLRAETSNKSLIPLSGIQLGGTGRNRSITVTPSAWKTGTARVIVFVSDGTDEVETSFKVVVYSHGTGPDIEVQHPKGSILVNGAYKSSFGTVIAGRTGHSKTFTIKNVGSSDLKGLSISKSGFNAKEFTIFKPLNSTVIPGKSTTFKVTFKPLKEGFRKTSIHIKSNDPDENPFVIKVTGWGSKRS